MSRFYQAVRGIANCWACLVSVHQRLQGPMRPRRQGIAWLGIVGLLLCACGDTAQAPDTSPWETVSIARQRAAASPQIERTLVAAIAHARKRPGTASGVRAATDAGRLALLLMARGTHRELVGEAHSVLQRVGHEAGLPGLCDASLVEARLAHALAPESRSPREAVRELQARFGDLLSAKACLAEAARLARAWGAAVARPVGEEPGALPSDVVAGTASPGHGLATLLRVDVHGQEIERRGESRVVLSFDREVAYRRSERAARGPLPRRVVLDLDGARLGPKVEEAIELGRGGVDRVRLLQVGGKQVRVSFDIRDQTEYRMFFLPDPYRLVLDFRAVRRTAGGGDVRRVVLDPGHGGRNPGAKGPTGLRESDVALSLARRVRRALARKAPGLQVLLTRDSDLEVSLEERAAVANAVDADLFVSIHLNASHSPEDPGGVSTFVLDTSNDQQALLLAARENGSRLEEVSKLQVVLAGLHRQEQVERSRAAARAVQSETLSLARRVLPELPDRGVKSAMFYVLVGALMPAVLVEASFITRPDEERALRTDGYRAALSEGIANGIVRYARTRSRAVHDGR